MSQFHSTGSGSRQIHELEERIRVHEARLQSMIVRGAPTQAAEDQLRKLYQTLQEMKGMAPTDSRSLHSGLLSRPPKRLREFKWPR